MQLPDSVDSNNAFYMDFRPGTFLPFLGVDFFIIKTHRDISGQRINELYTTYIDKNGVVRTKIFSEQEARLIKPEVTNAAK
jgi:hypothetical protein